MEGSHARLVRALCYGGLRLGLYQLRSSQVSNRRTLLAMEEDQEEEAEVVVGRGSKTDMTTKVAAGCASGAFAAALLNPTELIKPASWLTPEPPLPLPLLPLPLLLFLDPSAASADEERRRDAGVRRAQRGRRGSVERGRGNVRDEIGGVDGVAVRHTYDEVKKGSMTVTGAKDGLFVHFSASMLAGLVTTTVTNPVDMIKTQLYMDKGSGVKGGEEEKFRGAECDADGGGEAWTDGTDMRGWSANYLRLGPQTVITFIALEKFRALAGMSSL